MLKNKKTHEPVNIDIFIKNPKDIFEGFGGNILNRDFEEYIFNSVRNYSLDKKIELIIYPSRESFEADLIKSSIHRHFDYRAKELGLQLRRQFFQWTVNMVIGVLFLVLCLILVEILEVFSYINIIKIIKESLLIIGWVALWEPVSFILFGWKTIKRDKLVCSKLSNITVSVGQL